MKKLTQERLKQLLHYNPNTGIFTRKKQIQGSSAIGTEAGYKNTRGYIAIMVDWRLYVAHRLVFLYMYGYIPEGEVDHIDRNRGNNRLDNLREATRQCNARNAGMLSNNKSGIKGVYFFKITGRWGANIKVNKKSIFLGYHLKKEDAAMARWNAEQRYNFPNCCTTSSSYDYLKKRNLI